MARLFGQEFTRSDLLQRVEDISQLAGVRLMRLEESALPIPTKEVDPMERLRDESITFLLTGPGENVPYFPRLSMNASLRSLLCLENA